ncbi:MAG: hypothetical protein IPP13_04345 [Kouleothrix sp.]|jgi:type VI protein secretion system component VasF|nr:hypothetical protein [Kouleothrix sp.]
MPPHLQIELEYEDEELARLDKRLANAQRNKKRGQSVQQVVNTAGGFKRLLLPAPQAPRRRKKSLIQQVQIWLARLGLAVVFCIMAGVVFWWQLSASLHPSLQL